MQRLTNFVEERMPILIPDTRLNDPVYDASRQTIQLNAAGFGGPFRLSGFLTVEVILSKPQQ